MRRSTTRAHGLSILALAAAVPLLLAAPAEAQSQGPIPYDAQRGVFTFASGLEQALPAVVQVTTLGQSEGPSSGENEPKPVSSGSGAIIDAREGIVVTNNHVVEGGRKFTVDLADGRIFDAVLIGSDKATDLAVLKFEATGLSEIEIVNSDQLRTGDLAFAVGYPLGLDQTLTMGVISGLGGSTGAILGSLNAERSREFGLGIVRGAVVENVAPGSAAEAAGLRRGDVVTRIQNRPVSNAGTVAATIGIAEPGTEVQVVYLRDGREGRATLTVEAQVDRSVVIGSDVVVARGLSARAVADGLQVFAVEGGSVAAGAGLQAGDLIRLVDDSAVTSLEALAAALEGDGQRILSVMRGDEPVEITLP